MAGQMVHFEILAKDADAAQAFWSGLFGWEFGTPMEEMDYRMARIDDTSGAAIAGGEGKSHPNVYLSTDDIDASLAKVRELGGEAGGQDAGPADGLVRRLQGRPGHGVPSLAGGLGRRLSSQRMTDGRSPVKVNPCRGAVSRSACRCSQAWEAPSRLR